MARAPAWLLRTSCEAGFETDREADCEADCEHGASAVEYGLLAAGVAALVVAIVFAFGGVVSSLFTGTCDSIDKGTSSSAVPISC